MNVESSPLLLQLGAMLVLLAINGFFVAVEFAYVTVPRPRIDQLVHHGDTRAARVQTLLADTDRVLATAQAGITAASLGLGWFGENATKEILRLGFGVLPPMWDTAIANSAGILIAFAVITSFHIVLGEQAPKIIAIHAADRFALLSARIVAFLDILLRPFVWFLNDATTAVVRLLGMPPVGAHQTIYTTEELKQLVSETYQSGEMTTQEKNMIHNVFEVGDLTAREVMTPRPDIVAVDEATTIGNFLQTFVKSTHSRFPVFANNIDNMIGFVTVKDVMYALATQGPAARDELVRKLLRPAIIVPESKRIGNLFVEMQTQNVQLAVIIDEFGGTAGIVTLEEILEEIVGRIGDELAHEEPRVVTIDDKTVQLDAQMRVEEVNEQLGLGLPTREDYETVSGFVLYAIRRIPKEGDQFKVANLNFKIARMVGPKIDRVAITRL
jgi:CBS domain containing-hemolysin-like protein